MYVFFTEKWREVGKLLFLYVILLNKDISCTVLDIVLQFCRPVIYTHPEGSVSQICFIWALVFILCDLQNNVLKICFHLR